MKISAINTDDLFGGSGGVRKEYIRNVGVEVVAGEDLATKAIKEGYLYFIQDIASAAIYIEVAEDPVWYGTTGFAVAGSTSVRDGLLPYEGQRFYDTTLGQAFQYLGGSWTGTTGEVTLRLPTYVIVTGSTTFVVGRNYLVASATGSYTLQTSGVQDGHSIVLETVQPFELQTPVYYDGQIWDGNIQGGEFLTIEGSASYQFVYYAGTWYAFSNLLPDSIVQAAVDLAEGYAQEAAQSVQEVSGYRNEFITYRNQSQQAAHQSQVAAETVQLRFIDIESRHGDVDIWYRSIKDDLLQMDTRLQLATEAVDAARQQVTHVQEVLNSANNLLSETSQLLDDTNQKVIEAKEAKDLSVAAAQESANSASASLHSKQDAEAARDSAAQIQQSVEDSASQASQSATSAAQSVQDAIEEVVKAKEHADSASDSSRSAEDSASLAEDYRDETYDFRQEVLQSTQAAAQSASDAEGSSQDANSSRQLAQRWATEERGVEVEGGRESAYSYMLQAFDYRNDAMQASQAISGGMYFADFWDASTGEFPPTPAEGSALYKVNVAGSLGGRRLEIGDSLIYHQTSESWVFLETSFNPISWDEVQSKPVTATRWPTFSEVVEKPTTFPPSTHTHGYGDLPINAAQVSNWDAAYSWGNHADAGYATGENFNPSGTYSGLRAQATTKADVGLANVPNTVSVQTTSSNGTRTIERIATLTQENVVTTNNITKTLNIGSFNIGDIVRIQKVLQEGNLTIATNSGDILIPDNTSADSHIVEAGAACVIELCKVSTTRWSLSIY